MKPIASVSRKRKLVGWALRGTCGSGPSSQVKFQRRSRRRCLSHEPETPRARTRFLVSPFPPPVPDPRPTSRTPSPLTGSGSPAPSPRPPRLLPRGAVSDFANSPSTWAHQKPNGLFMLCGIRLEANARRERYKIDDCKPASSSVAVDPRLRGGYQEADTLVGIDGPRKEVVTRLMDTQKKLKVVSIVGFSGLGKTTLAKQRPDMIELLNNLQYKLGMKESNSSRPRKVDDIIEELREHLKKRRYLIVVDDVWDESTWNIIKCAFPEDGNGSRVIATTRVEVITIASLLASEERSLKGWVSIRDYLGAQSATNPTLEEMKSILNLSYMHLPAHFRACFLYLGMYAEDCEILRDDLIRQWIAEGFIISLHVQDLEDVGRSYFNELVNRSMIQPYKNVDGKVCCKVHDMMLDLILSKCVEDNFISVAYNYEGMARLHSRKHKYLRVLKIDQGRARGDEETRDLTAISQLFQLRYFQVLGPYPIKLPSELQGLVYLETLDIPDACPKTIPSDIVHLSRLSYLNVWMEEGLPELIGNMKALRSLRISNSWVIHHSMQGIMGLGELTNLRELMIEVGPLEKPELDALVWSIGRLCNLKHLQILGLCSKGDNQLGSLSNPFQHLEELHVSSLNFCRVPIWMGGLHCLRILDLRVEETSTEEVYLLVGLPSLVNLIFKPSHIPKERAMLDTGLFPVLEYLEFWSQQDVMGYLGFEAGAMPNLQFLTVHFIKEWGGSIPVGMEHLSRLQEILLKEAYSDDAIVSMFRNDLFISTPKPPFR
uniref:Disease resistance protein RPM1 n=1 Tax=Aegilops tauschii TaxID=37682 RepID=M8C236_AEGTA